MNYEQQNVAGMIPLSSNVFATIEGVNEDEKLLKLIVEPWGEETGWCRVLKDTFYTIPSHPNGGEHEPKWPYEVGQEVLAAVVRGDHGSEEYVVLGLIE